MHPLRFERHLQGPQMCDPINSSAASTQPHVLRCPPPDANSELSALCVDTCTPRSCVQYGVTRLPGNYRYSTYTVGVFNLKVACPYSVWIIHEPHGVSTLLCRCPGFHSVDLNSARVRGIVGSFLVRFALQGCYVDSLPIVYLSLPERCAPYVEELEAFLYS